jgi:ankyrin repeat protein
MFACHGGHSEVVAELLSRGADIELCTFKVYTACLEAYYNFTLIL